MALDNITKIKTTRLANEIDKVFSINESIKKAIIGTNREDFVPRGFKHNAYKLDALPMGESQWISSPLTVAKMSMYLDHKDADSVLEIGCGSGYQAAVLSHLFRRVFTIERIEPLLLEAQKRFRASGTMNVHTKLDDGQSGWKQFAPFDRILFSASIKEIPKALFSQLSDGGILIAPIEKGSNQVITKFTKYKSKVVSMELESCIFVPVLNGIKR